jgi:hypothetical protein
MGQMECPNIKFQSFLPVYRLWTFHFLFLLLKTFKALFFQAAKIS